jgi:hypothetical protein
VLRFRACCLLGSGAIALLWGKTGVDAELGVGALLQPLSDRTGEAKVLSLPVPEDVCNLRLRTDVFRDSLTPGRFLMPR